MTRRCSLATITAAVAAVFTITPALAFPSDETVDADAAVVEGTANVGVLQFVGGSGSFGFISQVCVVASTSGLDGEPGEQGPDVEASQFCSAQASGVYNNIVCGTGTAAGTGTLDEGAGSDVYDASFNIAFLAGVGVLAGNATETEGGVTVGSSLPRNLAGLVVLAAQLPGPQNGCTVQFTAVADLVTTA